MVDLASSPSKRDNEGEPAVAMVDLVSSPSKGPTSVRYIREKTQAQKNIMIVPPNRNRSEMRYVCCLTIKYLRNASLLYVGFIL